MSLYPHKVPITIDGVVVKCEQGTNSFQNIIDAAGSVAAKGKVKLTVVSTVSKASTIGPNDSYVIDGGEVFTSS
jgi:hypothetical protein